MADPTLPLVRFSHLKAMAKSPRHYSHGILHDRADTPGMRMGRAIHTLTLGPQPAARPVVVYPGDRRGNAWKEFRAAHPDDRFDVLTEAEHDTARACAEAVCADPVASPLLAGERETYIEWMFGERACRSTLDVIGPTWIADLKSTHDASPIGFQRIAWRQSYHAQMSFYRHAVAWRTPDLPPPRVWLIAVEQSPPYAVCVHEVTEPVLEMGTRLWRSWFEALRGCEDSRDFPGYPSPVEWSMGEEQYEDG